MTSICKKCNRKFPLNKINQAKQLCVACAQNNPDKRFWCISYSILILIGFSSIYFVYKLDQPQKPTKEEHFATLQREAEENFSLDSSAVLSDINDYKNNKDWETVKTKTSFLLNTNSPEITQLYNEATIEIEKAKEERRKEAIKSKVDHSAIWFMDKKNFPRDYATWGEKKVTQMNKILPEVALKIAESP